MLAGDVAPPTTPWGSGLPAWSRAEACCTWSIWAASGRALAQCPLRVSDESGKHSGSLVATAGVRRLVSRSHRLSMHSVSILGCI